MTAPSISFVLPTASHFDLAETVDAYGPVQLPPWRWDGEAQTLWRAERFDDGGVGLLSIAQSGAQPLVTVHREGVSQEEAARRATWLLQAELHFDAFHDLCRSHPALVPIAERRLGRMLRSATLFEDAVKAVCWTNITWPQAVKATQKLGELGDLVPGGDLRAFPTPAQIAAAGEPYLRDVCRLGYRAPYLVALAEGAASGALDFEGLTRSSADLPTPALMKRLKALRGVGPASATYLLATLGRYDVVYVDSSVLAYFMRHITDGRKPTEREVRDLFAPYGEWRGLVAGMAQHLGLALGGGES
ncbi:MAG: Fe-S cluster assembly protein HesB [Chloroflexi bacterium]|nr:Fe-S cluster assembly protein HesB [Chloroflexota bacterium]